MEEDVECITIPKKLMEDIYLDYLKIISIYSTSLNENNIENNDKEYWKYYNNDRLIEIIERIKFYLEK